MKLFVKQVLGKLSVLAVLCVPAFANYSSPYGYTTGAYGTGYANGVYNYGQAYYGANAQTNYYSQGYNNYYQGYQGSYQQGTNVYGGMGNSYQYVDNGWIEDQLKFAVSDVNQNQPYSAMSRLQTISNYVRQFGDSELYRRVAYAAQLGYKSSLASEINSIYNSWRAGNLRVGWEASSNQSYSGQDDISKSYIVGELNSVMQELSGNQQNRGRQRLWALVQAIPPMGNDRLIRRIQYAGSVTKPSQMRSEVQSIISEINSGSLILNDTENSAYNFYYGGSTNPYTLPDQGGSATGGSYYNNGYPGTTTTTTTGTATTYTGANYLSTSGNDASLGYDSLNYSGTTYAPSAATTTTDATATTAAAATPAVDVQQLKANVAAAYSELKAALAEGDRGKITDAQAKYAAAQSAYEAAK
jgi:hypothetical protein